MRIKYYKSNFRTYDVRISVVNDLKLRFNIRFQRDGDVLYLFTVYDVDSLIAILSQMTCINNHLIKKGLSVLKSGRYTDVIYLSPVGDLPF